DNLRFDLIGRCHTALNSTANLSVEPGQPQTLLRYAVLDDLRVILASMGDNNADEGDVVNRATKRIYNLRNSLVHY
ncbi:hypothetical protein, partial [Paraburkholderia tuberum]|uniref:hypothetical protein n=1 Tax=Paraburkholderia tuberum TaxID=157910 RepID=UPI001ABD23F9